MIIVTRSIMTPITIVIFIIRMIIMMSMSAIDNVVVGLVAGGKPESNANYPIFRMRQSPLTPEMAVL